MKDFKKYYIIPAPPEEVYLALTLEHTIRLWTGDTVEMVAEPGTEFSLWDGNIVGKNLEFDPGKKLCSNGILVIMRKNQSSRSNFIPTQKALHWKFDIPTFPMKIIMTYWMDGIIST